MAFVFYDTETTGVSTDFDQILQFAAIKTDEKLQELDRFEIRSRLLPHVLPHPAALCVTGKSIGDVTNPELPSHYEMLQTIRQKLLEWSPAIFVGYNSMSFDEHLLRQALFQNLHPPYLTNTNGNCRADALALVQAASVFAPECLKIPLGNKGVPVYKLDQVAPLNGFDHENAHDALADVEATIHLAQCIRQNAAPCWDRFVRFSKKATVADFVHSENVFVLTEFYFNRPYHYPVACFATDQEQAGVCLCLDLTVDLEALSALDDDALVARLQKSPRPVRRVRTNAAPLVASIAALPESVRHGLSIEELTNRAHALKSDEALIERLRVAFEASKEDKPVSEHIEQHIYLGFIGRDDEALMAAFHKAPWESRSTIVERLEDLRLKHFGRRLIHAHVPDAMDPAHRVEIEALYAARLHPAGDTKVEWTTVSIARDAIAERLAASVETETEILVSYKAYLDTRFPA